MDIAFESQRARSMGIDVQPGADAPDFILFVFYQPHEDPPRLRYLLMRSNGAFIREFEPVDLETDIAAWASSKLKLLDLYNAGLAPSPNGPTATESEELDRRIKQLGRSLWNDLIPRDFKDYYASSRFEWKDRTLLILSDEPYIPWELVWPYGRGPAWEDAGPWSLTCRPTRWLRRDSRGNGHDGPPTSIPIRNFACLVPGDTNLGAARWERVILPRVFAAKHVTDVSPANVTINDVLDRLRDPHGPDLLHFSTHGGFDAASPDSASPLLLESGMLFTPDDLADPDIEESLAARRPAVVLSACHAGEQGQALTRIGGWTNRFIGLGASLVIAPRWSVNDASARTFCAFLYKQLLDGVTVAEAVWAARDATRTEGDPSWVAWSVYAHPNARFNVVSSTAVPSTPEP